MGGGGGEGSSRIKCAADLRRSSSALHTAHPGTLFEFFQEETHEESRSMHHHHNYRNFFNRDKHLFGTGSRICVCVYVPAH